MPDLRQRPFYLDEEQEEWVRKTKEELTLEEKIGQLFCVMGGDYKIEELETMVREGKVGGVLYRPDPAEEIRKRYQILDQAAKVPLLKAANLEEGGAGAISDGTLFGWPMMVSAADDDHMVEKFARVCAVEGQRAGINWSFSPVCDLDLNYRNPITNVRSYGSDKERVKRNTEIYVRTMQECGMAACAKHFPGDGVDFRDHHLHPTYNSLSAEEWYASYGMIYENLIQNNLMSIMAGHIVQASVAKDRNPALTFEECLPASQSRELLTGVLREKYKFNGVITTDATIMGGYCMTMERKYALPGSIMAGCDMIVFNTNFAEDYDDLPEGVRKGLLTRERLDEAVERILALKACVCEGNRKNKKDRPAEESIAALRWRRECADKAVTLVKNRNPQVLPVTRGSYDCIRLISLGKDKVSEGSIREMAGEILRKKGFEVEYYHLYEDDLHGCKNLQKRRLTLYLANYEQASNQTEVRIHWCEKHALDTPRFLSEEDCIFVSFSNPYHLQDVPRIKTYINAYTATKSTVEAVIQKLLGESEFTGISPVDAFCGIPDTKL